mgnify:CR=1 FL=1
MGRTDKTCATMKKWMQIIALLLIFSGTIVLLIVGHQQEGDMKMNAPHIQIEVQDGIALLTENEVAAEYRKQIVAKETHPVLTRAYEAREKSLANK